MINSYFVCRKDLLSLELIFNFIMQDINHSKIQLNTTIDISSIKFNFDYYSLKYLCTKIIVII